MTRLLDIVTTGCIALLIGTELTVSLFINPILWRLETPAQMNAIRMFAKRLGTVMPFWYAASLVLLLIETTTRRHDANMGLLVMASCIWAAVVVLSVLLLVPINNRLAQINSNSVVAVAHQQHRKWDTMHRYRIAALGISMLCFLVATVS